MIICDITSHFLSFQKWFISVIIKTNCQYFNVSYCTFYNVEFIMSMEEFGAINSNTFWILFLQEMSRQVQLLPLNKKKWQSSGISMSYPCGHQGVARSRLGPIKASIKFKAATDVTSWLGQPQNKHSHRHDSKQTFIYVQAKHIHSVEEIGKSSSEVLLSSGGNALIKKMHCPKTVLTSTDIVM